MLQDIMVICLISYCIIRIIMESYYLISDMKSKIIAHAQRDILVANQNNDPIKNMLMPMLGSALPMILSRLFSNKDDDKKNKSDKSKEDEQSEEPSEENSEAIEDILKNLDKIFPGLLGKISEPKQSEDKPSPEDLKKENVGDNL
jgi:hypothetical protein